MIVTVERHVTDGAWRQRSLSPAFARSGERSGRPADRGDQRRSRSDHRVENVEDDVNDNAFDRVMVDELL